MAISDEVKAAIHRDVKKAMQEFTEYVIWYRLWFDINMSAPDMDDSIVSELEERAHQFALKQMRST